MTFGFASVMVCFALVSFDYTIEAVGFVLSWSVSYFIMFLKFVVWFALTSFFLPFTSPKQGQDIHIIQYMEAVIQHPSKIDKPNI